MKFKDWKKLRENKNKTLNDFYAYLRSNDKLNFEEFNESNFESTPNNASQSTPNHQGIKKEYWQYLTYTIIALSLFITNPSLSEHKDGIVEQIQKDVRNDVGDLGIFNGIRDWSLDKVGRGVISVTNRRTFILFSVCDVSVLGVPIGYSVGILGNTWIIYHDEL